MILRSPMFCVALLFGVTGLGCSTVGTESRWKEPFFFVQMADPQFGMWSGNKDFEKETELFERAVAHANRLRPAFVVVCGDLTHKAGDSRQTQEFLRISRQLDDEIPIYLVAGNHDVENEPTPQSLERYRETFGDDWYSFRHQGCVFIVLNTTIAHRSDNVAEEERKQFEWLRGELERAKDGATQIVVFQHHPLFLKEPGEADAYFNLPQPKRRRYLELFRAAGVSAVFAGHYHRNSHGRDGALEMVTSGPVGKPLGEDPSGFRVVKVFRDRLQHEYYALDSVPDTISLPAAAVGPTDASPTRDSTTSRYDGR